MTNNPTIDGVSRELLETVVSTCAFTLPEVVYQELRALLDAPDICPTCDSRGGCPDCKPEPVLLGYRIETEHGHHFKDSPTRGIGINCIELTDRSEVAALQSTIAQLQARTAALNEGSK